MGFFIFCLIVCLIWICWGPISRWLRRQAANKAEDFIRNATGMPPRPGSRKERRQRRENERRQEGTNESYYSRQRTQRRHYGAREPLIPKEYAEDVEYVETKDFSRDTTIEEKKSGSEKSYHESQISDAEWTEIKNP